MYIRTTPDITISEHSVGDNIVYEQPKSAPVTLLIDKGRRWAFGTQREYDKQTDIKNYVERWTEDAAKQMKISIDTHVLANIYADASAYNQGATAGYRSAGYNLGVSGTPLAITKADVVEKITDCASVLDEYDVPEEGRWMVIPIWMANRIQKSDLKDASLAGDDTSIARNGRLGMIANMTLYKSNLLKTNSSGGKTATEIIFGTNHALTFASQLTENESLKNPFAFGQLYRGLQVFGYKVVKPQALGLLHAYAA